ncbi:unnamed protein product [Rhizoctonia solani]|uniref:Uncharacterized protein n=1 Tax=Rhizoctonia solani TaxID=456999 RepID=A0A8H3BLH2_9AGAM|nr:unnamed protein product [Rhizoctonia solani]
MRCGSEHPVKPSIVVGYLSGICSNLEPLFPNVHNIRTAPLVSKTLVGLKKRFGSPAKQKSAISVQEISDVHSILSLSSSYDDWLFLALLSVGFTASIASENCVGPTTRRIDRTAALFLVTLFESKMSPSRTSYLRIKPIPVSTGAIFGLSNAGIQSTHYPFSIAIDPLATIASRVFGAVAR